MKSSLKQTTPCLAITFVLSCFLVLSANAQSHQEASYVIDKSQENDRLIATVEGQRYWITNHDDPDRKFDLSDLLTLNIEEQIDFDNDGNMDVLISASNGGAASIPSYLIASHLGGHYFHISTAEKLYTYGDYELLPQADGTTYLKVYYAVDGVGYHERSDGFGVYSLNYGQVEQIAEVTNHAQIPTVFEVTSAEMAKNQNQTFNFDLDHDGIDDQLICRYWERWGDLMCDIDLSTAGLLRQNWGADQLGVAETSTNGVHDLIVNWVSLFVFDGSHFAEQAIHD